MPAWLKSLCKRFLLIVPFVLGFIGLMIAGETSVPDALFNSLTMYVLNYGQSPANILVELARWLAPLATVGSVFLAVKYLRDRLRYYLVNKTGKSTVVYGPDADQKNLLSQLGKYGIPGRDTFVKAQRYILADSEEKNLQFWEEHKEELKGRKVFIKCTTLPAQLMTSPDIRLFSLEENAARLFWKEHCLYALSKEKKHQLNIAFVGFGKLGEALLYHGLLNNIFSEEQQITYHIFGDCSSFLHLHKEMDQISDKVIMHTGQWTENADIIEQADRVLLLHQHNQTDYIYGLKMLFPQKQIIVFQQNSVFSELFAEYDGLEQLNWSRSANQIEYILNEKLLSLAKSINLMYAHAYSDVEINDKNLELEWNKINSFTRESNICAADYHEIRLRMLEAEGLPKVFSSLSEGDIDNLCRLEHIRWCRFHYLNNWNYGVAENGKNKDTNKRIHKDLIDYDQLTEAEKDRDRNSIMACFLLSN